MNFFTERNVRSVIATRYSVEAQNHYQTLQERLAEARAEIDKLSLAEHRQRAPRRMLRRAPTAHSSSGSRLRSHVSA